MHVLKEFKEYAVHGNLVNMAVGIIIDSAFGKIVSSLVQDVIMPPIGLIVGNVDGKMDRGFPLPLNAEITSSSGALPRDYMK